MTDVIYELAWCIVSGRVKRCRVRERMVYAPVGMVDVRGAGRWTAWCQWVELFDSREVALRHLQARLLVDRERAHERLREWQDVWRDKDAQLQRVANELRKCKPPTQRLVRKDGAA